MVRLRTPSIQGGTTSPLRTRQSLPQVSDPVGQQRRHPRSLGQHPVRLPRAAGISSAPSRPSNRRLEQSRLILVGLKHLRLPRRNIRNHCSRPVPRCHSSSSSSHHRHSTGAAHQQRQAIPGPARHLSNRNPRLRRSEACLWDRCSQLRAARHRGRRHFR